MANYNAAFTERDQDNYAMTQAREWPPLPQRALLELEPQWSKFFPRFRWGGRMVSHPHREPTLSSLLPLSRHASSQI
jgi:hypothetical protein